MAEGDGPDEAVLRTQGLVVAFLTRAAFPHQGARLQFRSEDARGKLGPHRGGPRRRRCRSPDAEVQGSGNEGSAGRRVVDRSALGSHSRRTHVKLDAELEVDRGSSRERLQKLRGKVDTTPTKRERPRPTTRQRPPQHSRPLAAAGQLQTGRSHEGVAFGGVEPEGRQKQAKEGQEQGQEQLRVQSGNRNTHQQSRLLQSESSWVCWRTPSRIAAHGAIFRPTRPAKRVG